MSTLTTRIQLKRRLHPPTRPLMGTAMTGREGMEMKPIQRPIDTATTGPNQTNELFLINGGVNRFYASVDPKPHSF